jgi:hypothetical protein
MFDRWNALHIRRNRDREEMNRNSEKRTAGDIVLASSTDRHDVNRKELGHIATGRTREVYLEASLAAIVK